MNEKHILETYYKGLAKKQDWEAVIANDFNFTGPNNSAKTGQAYVDITKRFLQLVKLLKVKSMVAEGEQVCAVVHYTLQSPKGTQLALDIAEVWQVKNGQACALTLFFDTAAFATFISG